MRLKTFLNATIITVSIFLCLSASAQSSKFKVTLDAGHGAKDFGAVYNGHIEKNIALAVTLKVGRILESTPGFEVIYTRKTDVFIDLIERANIANRADSHIFVSIHCNANANSAASGTETYVMGMTKNASNLEVARKENAVITMEKDYQQKYKGFDPKSPESVLVTTAAQELYLENSIALAGKIQDIFTDALHKKSRGVKQAPYMVLHKAYMPRVLIEMGFISNPQDGSYLDSDEGQDETAKAIADAIIGYKKEYFGSGLESNEPVQKPSEIMEEPVVKNPTPDDTVVPQKPVVKVDPVTKPAGKPVIEEAQPVAPGVVFKVQLAVSSTKLDLVPANFKGLNNVTMVTANNLYKYLYGWATTYEDARRQLGDVKAKGYGSAFIVAFRDGKSISVQEALKQR
jgi:N-acetylmuramoyl-L-alanine amidase